MDDLYDAAWSALAQRLDREAYRPHGIAALRAAVIGDHDRLIALERNRARSFLQVGVLSLDMAIPPFCAVAANRRCEYAGATYSASKSLVQRLARCFAERLTRERLLRGSRSDSRRLVTGTLQQPRIYYSGKCARTCCSMNSPAACASHSLPGRNRRCRSAQNPARSLRQPCRCSIKSSSSSERCANSPFERPSPSLSFER